MALALLAWLAAAPPAQGRPDRRPGTVPRTALSAAPARTAHASTSPRAAHAKPGPDAASAAAAPGSITLPDHARIGDRIRLSASYAGAGSWTAAPGDDLKPGEKLGPFRILAADAGVPGVLSLDLGPDETGVLTVPAFQVVFRDAGGVSVTVAVPSAQVTVASVLAEGDSTAIADLKPPAEMTVPWPWGTIALLAAALGLAGVATLWLARYLRRERAPRPAPEIVLPPGMTAEAWAREELAKILAAGLFDAGRHRELHIALADLVRRYLELRFRLPAMERTTEEIGHEMPGALVEGTIVRLTLACLERCDRVKFAKHVPSRDEAEETLAQIREILDRGAPAPAPARSEPPETAPPAAIDATAGTAA